MLNEIDNIIIMPNNYTLNYVNNTSMSYIQVRVTYMKVRVTYLCIFGILRINWTVCHKIKVKFASEAKSRVSFNELTLRIPCILNLTLLRVIQIIPPIITVPKIVIPPTFTWVKTLDILHI